MRGSPGQPHKTTSDWFEIARSIGIGDMLWMVATYLIGNRENLIHDGNVMLPLLIGPIVCMTNYQLQKRHIRQTHNAPPDAEQKKTLKSDSAGLGFKMAFSMLGWEAAVLIAQLSLASLKNTDKTAYHVTTGLISGLGQAIGVCTTNAGLEWISTGEKQSTNLDIAKLFATCFISGAVWYFISIGDYSPKTSGWTNKGINATLGSLITLIAVTAVFSGMKPQQSWRSFRMGAQLLGTKLSSLFSCGHCCKTKTSPVGESTRLMNV